MLQMAPLAARKLGGSNSNQVEKRRVKLNGGNQKQKHEENVIGGSAAWRGGINRACAAYGPSMSRAREIAASDARQHGVINNQ